MVGERSPLVTCYRKYDLDYILFTLYPFSGQQIVDQWYAEEPDYDYTGTGNVMKAGKIL